MAPETFPEYGAAPLRIAVIVGNGKNPAWVQEAIRRFESIAGVDLACRINVPTDSSQIPYSGSLPNLFSLLEDLDRRVFAESGPNAFEMIDLEIGTSELVSIAAEIVDEHVEPGDFASQIGGDELDFIVNFCPYLVGIALRDSCSGGVLEVHHAEDTCPNTDWGYWRSLKQKKTKIRTSLIWLESGTGDQHMLFDSYAAVHDYSLFRTRNQVYWKAACFPEYVLRRVRTFGLRRVLEQSSSSSQFETRRYPRPRAALSVDLAIRIGFRYLSMKVGTSLQAYQWGLVLYKGSNLGAPVSVAWLPGFTLADPFLFEHKGETGVFYEILKLGENRADIAYSRIQDDGSLSSPITVLSRQYHLSYPQVFEWQGSLYMIPETRGNRTIEIYKAEQYPKRWRLERILFNDVNAVDSTVLFHDNKLWLFTCIGPDGGSTRDELFIYFADSLDRDWTPHPMNPVISDVSLARPAGAIFEQRGRLIRPSQDNSVRYGFGVNFNEIEVLNVTNYRERRVGGATPEDLGRGMAVHTYNRGGGFTVLDIAEAAGRSPMRDRAEFKYSTIPVPASDFDPDGRLA